MRDWKEWFKAAGIRALKTLAQTAVAMIGTTALIDEVNWPVVASSAGLAGILSLLTSIAGLPEVKLAKIQREAPEELKLSGKGTDEEDGE